MGKEYIKYLNTFKFISKTQKTRSNYVVFVAERFSRNGNLINKHRGPAIKGAIALKGQPIEKY